MSKICPFCGGQIPDNAQKCRHCGEWVVPPEQRRSFDSYSLEDTPRRSSVPTGTPYYNNSYDNGDMNAVRPQGFFDLFLVKTLFRHYSDYRGRVSRRDFWCALFAYAVVSMAVSGICWGLTAVVPYGTEFVLTLIISIIWGALTILPVTALMARRLNDAAYSTLWLLLLLVPFVGWAGLALLCSLPTAESNRNKVSEHFAFNVADAILIVLCAAIFITGWLAYDGVITFGGGETDVVDSTIVDSVSLFESDTLIETAPAPSAPAAVSADSSSVPSAPVSAPAEGNPVAPSSGYDPELGYDTAAYL